MIRKIAFVNGKGGVGKTTSIFHVCGVLAQRGEKVLAIDLDKQRNTTDILMMNTEPDSRPKKTAFDFLTGAAGAEEAIGAALFQSRGNAKPRHYGVDCMVSDVRLEDEAALAAVDSRAIGHKLDQLAEKRGYTYLLVDMPPSNKRLNDICFSNLVDYCIIPFSSDIFSVRGYGDIMDAMEQARAENPTLNVLGVYLSRFMGSCAVDHYIRSQLAAFETFIDVQIPLMADVRESVMFGRPISYYKQFSKSRRAYERLVEEMDRRMAAL